MLEITVGLFVIFVALWFVWRKHNFSYFKSLGIPGPPPNILFGNLYEYIRKGPLKCQQEWIDKYGKVLGYYYGFRPILLVADPDLLRNIQQKDFHSFVNRPAIFAIGSTKEDVMKSPLTNIKDKKWKEVRSIITPNFTISKLRQMAPIMTKAVDEMIESLDQEANKGKPFDIYQYYQRLTMDVIGRTAFGIQTQVQKNVDEPFLRSAKAFLSMRLGILPLFVYSFPEFMFVFSRIRRMILTFRNEGKNPLTDMGESSTAIIKARRSDPKNRRPDLLQLMMDAKMTQDDMNNVIDRDLTAGEEAEASALKTNDAAAASNTPKSTLQTSKLSDEEISENAVLFFIAGFETTSTALAFITHVLIKHQDVQEKVRNEVNELLKSENTFDYTSVQKLQYLDQVLNESLRVFPPIYQFINREASEDVDYGSIHIKKGMTIQAPVYSLHHDPSLWEDPEEFKPERFSSENKSKNHPMAWQPFGAGPRNCVGMRFAQMEMKLALAKLLNKYRIVPCQETEKDPIKLSVSNAIIRPEKGIICKLEAL